MAQSADRLSETIECMLCEHSIVMNKIFHGFFRRQHRLFIE